MNAVYQLKKCCSFAFLFIFISNQLSWAIPYTEEKQIIESISFVVKQIENFDLHEERLTEFVEILDDSEKALRALQKNLFEVNNSHLYNKKIKTLRIQIKKLKKIAENSSFFQLTQAHQKFIKSNNDPEKSFLEQVYAQISEWFESPYVKAATVVISGVVIWWLLGDKIMSLFYGHDEDKEENKEQKPDNSDNNKDPKEDEENKGKDEKKSKEQDKPEEPKEKIPYKEKEITVGVKISDKFVKEINSFYLNKSVHSKIESILYSFYDGKAQHEIEFFYNSEKKKFHSIRGNAQKLKFDYPFYDSGLFYLRYFVEVKFENGTVHRAHKNYVELNYLKDENHREVLLNELFDLRLKKFTLDLRKLKKKNQTTVYKITITDSKDKVYKKYCSSKCKEKCSLNCVLEGSRVDHILLPNNKQLRIEMIFSKKNSLRRLYTKNIPFGLKEVALKTEDLQW